MSEKEFLKALEEDTRRKCQAILEKARIEAETLIKETADNLEEIRGRELERVKSLMQWKRCALLARARLNAMEILLKERWKVAETILDEATRRLMGMRSDRDYPVILERLFEEAMDRWRIHGMGQKAMVILSKEDIPLLDIFSSYSGCEIVADETGTIPPGVIVTSQDGKYRVLNTLLSRLEKVRLEMIMIIDRILFSGEKVDGPRLPQ